MAGFGALAGLAIRFRPTRAGDPVPTATEGDGQLARDLEPGSLFLRDLGTLETGAAKVVVVYGRLGAKRSGETDPFADVDGKSDSSPSPLGRLGLPEEITAGDGCVSARCARLPGARETIATRLDHLALKSDPEAIALVIRLLTADPSTKPMRRPAR
jgi:hypothetical protein